MEAMVAAMTEEQPPRRCGAMACRRIEQNSAVDDGDGCWKKKKMHQLHDGAMTVQRPLDSSGRTMVMVGRRRRCSGAGNLLNGAGDMKGWHAVEEWSRCAGHTRRRRSAKRLLLRCEKIWVFLTLQSDTTLINSKPRNIGLLICLGW